MLVKSRQLLILTEELAVEMSTGLETCTDSTVD